ncbi:MAG TPA: ABC transporter ATP-binding protein [Phycisphaerae bacterium]|nr:ABC transporter ATP-binding protein [Phycisphaerae bacterium]
MSVIAPSAATLAVENLSFAYAPAAPNALSDISFTTRPGEIIAIVGPNGCGKSTLLRLLVGELLPSTGRILLDSTDTRRLSRTALARRLALVPQLSTPGAFSYTVREIVLMARHAAHAGGGGMLGLSFETEDDLHAADLAMWAADVHHLADRPITALSGGERQRVAIARALAQNTPLLLLDEPTTALDLYHQLDLLDHLRSLAAQSRTLLLVTHDLHLADTLATRILLMDAGHLLADGPPNQILTPANLEPIYHVQVTRPQNAPLTFSRRTV